MVKTLTSATSKHAKEYRKYTASISTPEVCKVSSHLHHPTGTQCLKEVEFRQSNNHGGSPGHFFFRKEQGIGDLLNIFVYV